MSGISSIGAGGGIQQIMAMRQQIIDRSNLLQQIRTPDPGTSAEGSTPAGGFTDALKSALETVNASQTKAEGLSQAYEKGETVDVAKVMLARQEAGVAFEATLQVRNKLLTAYQDIMRMGV
ncbi:MULTISPECIES: flagellar hook-basal body complex protein FliE [unclassified Novosphingobium]|uniref:flagellar hook-basal body complex protein FliE n=1 Tax=Novosphingobium TaxID=165696 RepID=UPI001444D3DC|nr:MULTISPECIES: flagellar hook-basal body complex protein FliE [unclassified Novosphingobium]NKJ40714.1 flagellar hook-basal body complex protein FliE [Novosphingobium sp. SG720]NMN03005.1 flagellar hook-basal body complex protein FliE [Novosphingobium sp. SG919]NMN87008.1 flagellar hook-basal body complex protein FliE [Novosphingobium sp. SG916]